MTEEIILELPNDDDIEHVIETINEYDHLKKALTNEELDALDTLRWKLVERYKGDPNVEALSLEMCRIAHENIMRQLANAKLNS